jgi:hypothetical protein
VYCLKIYLLSHCIVFVFSDTSQVILKKNCMKNNFPNKRVLRNKTLSNIRAMEMNKTLKNQSHACPQTLLHHLKQRKLLKTLNHFDLNQKRLKWITKRKGKIKKSLIWRLPLVSKKRMNKLMERSVNLRRKFWCHQISQKAI